MLLKGFLQVDNPPIIFTSKVDNMPHLNSITDYSYRYNSGYKEAKN